MRGVRVCSVRLFCLMASLLVLTAAPASAQVGSGEITGIVNDQAGAAVPGVSVTITQVDTNRQRLLITSSDGVYSATSLVPGDYRIEVALSGFKPIRRDGVQVLTGNKLRVDFELAVGTVSEQVNVTADAPMVRAETASLGYVVRNDQVTQIPLNGRAYIGLASLAPGVALPANSQLPRINGGRPRTNEYLYDGISVLQPEPGQVAYFPVIDSIQEFKIESNSPPAEFGRFNGGVINLTMKSGANVFHGDGFEFYRNQALNARNYFQSTVPTKPDYHRNQFGGTAGGPIVKDHTFFFFDYQGQRQSIARTATSTVPTVLQRQGIFTESIAGRVPVIYDPATTVGSVRTAFPGNTIPAGRIDSVALSLLQRYPMPTSSGTANNYSRIDNEVGQPGSVGRAPRSPVRHEQGLGLRTHRLLPRRLPARHASAGWERRHLRHARATGHHGLVVRVELSAHFRRSPVQRSAHRQHHAHRRPNRGAVDELGRIGAEHSRHSVERPVPEYAADVSDQRLPATRIAAEHRVELPHRRV